MIKLQLTKYYDRHLEIRASFHYSECPKCLFTQNQKVCLLGNKTVSGSGGGYKALNYSWSQAVENVFFTSQNFIRAAWWNGEPLDHAGMTYNTYTDSGYCATLNADNRTVWSSFSNSQCLNVQLNFMWQTWKQTYFVVLSPNR